MSDKLIMRTLLIIFLMVSCGSNKSSNNIDGNLTIISSSNDVDKFLDSKDKFEKEIQIKEEKTRSTNYKDFKDYKNILTKKIGVHKVSSNNETLMLLSFNLYGDFRYWKSIAKLNQEFLDEDFTLHKGMSLSYYMPKRTFSFRPDGNPFLVKKGHSLSKISNIVYENWQRWHEIHQNNKPLVKNPNKIYAGFTLYYLPDGMPTLSKNQIVEESEYLEIEVNEKKPNFKKELIEPKKPKFKKRSKSISLLEKMKKRFLASEKVEKVLLLYPRNLLKTKRM